MVELSQNSNSFKLLYLSLLPARVKKIQSKMKARECLQDFPHYKSMGFFSNAQGQLTLQSLVKSGPNSNSSEILWLSSLPARMKKIRSTVSGGIRPKFELIQAFMVVLVTCKNEENRIKMKELECLQHFSHYKSMGFLDAQGQLTPQSLVESGPRYYGCPRYLQVRRRSDQN